MHKSLTLALDLAQTKQSYLPPVLDTVRSGTDPVPPRERKEGYPGFREHRNIATLPPRSDISSSSLLSRCAVKFRMASRDKKRKVNYRCACEHLLCSV